jgi:hypothetical protein
MDILGIAIENGGTFDNTGTFTDTNAFADAMVNGGTFNNNGTYNKQGNALTNLQVAFNNTGTVNVNAGTLQVATAFANNGVINVASGAVFQSNNANFTNDRTIPCSMPASCRAMAPYKPQ